MPVTGWPIESKHIAVVAPENLAVLVKRGEKGKQARIRKRIGAVGDFGEVDLTEESVFANVMGGPSKVRGQKGVSTKTATRVSASVVREGDVRSGFGESKNVVSVFRNGFDFGNGLLECFEVHC